MGDLAQIDTKHQIPSMTALLLSLACAAGCSGTHVSNESSVTAGNAEVGAAGGAGPVVVDCYSPLRPELQTEALPSAGVQGCACETYQASADGVGRVYCLGGRAVYCPKDLGRWIVGFDGPCSPWGKPTPLEVCTERRGGSTVARGTSCPSGFSQESGFSSAAGAGADATVDCCYPIRLSAENCTQAGFEVLEGNSTGDVLQTTCSNGKAVRAFVGESGSTVCCER